MLGEENHGPDFGDAGIKGAQGGDGGENYNCENCARGAAAEVCAVVVAPETGAEKDGDGDVDGGDTVDSSVVKQ